MKHPKSTVSTSTATASKIVFSDTWQIYIHTPFHVTSRLQSRVSTTVRTTHAAAVVLVTLYTLPLNTVNQQLKVTIVLSARHSTYQHGHVVTPVPIYRGTDMKPIIHRLDLEVTTPDSRLLTLDYDTADAMLNQMCSRGYHAAVHSTLGNSTPNIGTRHCLKLV